MGVQSTRCFPRGLFCLVQWPRYPHLGICGDLHLGFCGVQHLGFVVFHILAFVVFYILAFVVFYILAFVVFYILAFVVLHLGFCRGGSSRDRFIGAVHRAVFGFWHKSALEMCVERLCECNIIWYAPVLCGNRFRP
jgi:hypothetical protein